MNNKKGISLIVLVITIVVVIILAAAVILSLGENNPITDARLANVLQEKDSIESAVLTHVSAISSKEAGQYETYEIITGVDKLGNDLENYKIITDDASDVVTVNDGGKTVKLYKIDQARFKAKTALKISDNIAGANWYVNEYGKVFLIFPTDKSAPNYMVDKNGIMINGTLKTFVSHKQEATIGEGVLGENAVIPPVTATMIKDNPAKYYGKSITNYTATSSSVVGWQIFYSDGTNIYLMADKCIPLANVPAGKNGSAPVSPDTSAVPNAGSLTNSVIGQYSGTSEITSQVLKDLNSKFWDNLGDSSASNESTKTMAYLMDTSIWSNFKATYADYAIGGTTIELLVDSYNDKYNTNLETEINTTNYKYQIRANSADSYTDIISGVSNVNDRQFFVDMSQCGASGYWLASPGGTSYNGTFIVPTVPGSTGMIGASSLGSTMGFRPFICLNSSVTLNRDGAGYKIN